MDKLNLNSILKRKNIEYEIVDIINKFYNSKNNVVKPGIYVYGNAGIGKTNFITNLLKDNNFDIIYYDNSIIRNKQLIENITCNNLSNNNIVSLFNKKNKKIVIVLDEIDGINFGDKMSLNFLIKILRLKKTKKQKLETYSNCPVICINNNQNDKKILELMNVCSIFNLKKPKIEETIEIFKNLIPDIFCQNTFLNNLNLLQTNILNCVDNNLNKIKNILNYKKYNLLESKFLINFDSTFKNNINNNDNNNNNNNNDNNDNNDNNNNNNNDNNDNNDNNNDNQYNIKYITHNLLKNYYDFNNHYLINETNRTVVSLIFHENIISLLTELPFHKKINIYYKILNNFKFSDYIDRIIFQKQIWQLNDINYINKIFYNNFILYKYNVLKHIDLNKIIFTKILTKYSNEYNNTVYLNNLSLNLMMEKSDIFIFFVHLKNTYSIDEITNILYVYDINKLDINRIYKFINCLDNYKTTDNENNINFHNYENYETETLDFDNI